MQELAPQTEPCEEFPNHICFDSRLPDCEIVRRGVCQMSLSSFRQIYSMLRKNLEYANLPPLTPEPEIIKYDDNSIALNWWPHQIYRIKSNELFDHEGYVNVKGAKHHESYVEGELKEKKILEQKLQYALT